MTAAILSAPSNPTGYSGIKRFATPFLAIGAAFLSSGVIMGPSRQPDQSIEVVTPPDQIMKLAKLTATGVSSSYSGLISAERANSLIPVSAYPVERVAPFRFISSNNQSYPLALKCLSQAIYYEAANESRAGKMGVAQVVLNRVRHPAYPHSICGVVYEGWNKPVCQFSFVCDGSLLRPAIGARWTESQKVAKAALNGEISTEVGSSTNYHADYVVPRWAYTLSKVRQIDTHIFYRLPNRWGSASAMSARWAGSEYIPQIDRKDLLAMIGTEEKTEVAITTEVRGFVAPDVADRHADIDIGGRLDPAKEWRLSIPDPVTASRSYSASFASQGEDSPVPSSRAEQ